MPTTEEIISAARREMRPLLEPALNLAMEMVLTKARSVLDDAEQRRLQGLAEVADERANGLAEVAKERADVVRDRTELRLEIAAMHKHKMAREGRVELNIGGHHFETSVQTLRRVPHTFFDAYFSGRYAQDVCDDGSIFVDRDGKHFGHVLEYMRDGVVSVAEAGAQPSVSLLRKLKREFGFYCIELSAEMSADPAQQEFAYVMGGSREGIALTSMERYDALLGQWSTLAGMDTARSSIGACAVTGELYVTGGFDGNDNRLDSVERYSPSTDTWSTVASMPETRSSHAAVGVGSAMYVLGGNVGASFNISSSVLKFDAEQGIWSEVAPMPAERYRFAACAVGSEIYVFGGRKGGAAHATVFKYDTETDTWSTLAPMLRTEFAHRFLFVISLASNCSSLA
jgi:hypothetical protein